jgi:hypothetical protein
VNRGPLLQGSHKLPRTPVNNGAKRSVSGGD